MSEREAQEWQSRTRRGRERRPPAGKENRPANLAGPSAKAQAPKPLGHPCRSAEPDRERMSSSTRYPPNIHPGAGRSTGDSGQDVLRPSACEGSGVDVSQSQAWSWSQALSVPAGAA